MKKPVWFLGLALGLLTACDASYTGSAASGGHLLELPAGVLEIVGPYQDLTSVRINELDGCYEYRHVGPVETTYLPLRAKNGRPICTRAPDEAAPAA